MMSFRLTNKMNKVSLKLYKEVKMFFLKNLIKERVDGRKKTLSIYNLIKN